MKHREEWNGRVNLEQWAEDDTAKQKKAPSVLATVEMSMITCLPANVANKANCRLSQQQVPSVAAVVEVSVSESEMFGALEGKRACPVALSSVQVHEGRKIDSRRTEKLEYHGLRGSFPNVFPLRFIIHIH